MTAFEEIFQMGARLGLSIISKPAPHKRWRIIASLPCGATISGSLSHAQSDLVLSEVDANTPQEAAEMTLKILNKRFTVISNGMKEEREVTG